MYCKIKFQYTSYELYKFMLILFRKISIILLLFIVGIYSLYHTIEQRRYFQFLVITVLISFFSRTFEVRIFYDAFIIFVPLFIFVLNSNKPCLRYLALVLICMTIDLRWFSIQKTAYTFEPMLFVSPIVNWMSEL